MKNFRVLVIDDKKTVLDSIRDNIIYRHKFNNETYNVELLLLNIEVIKKDNKFKFTEESIRNLYDFCEKPFDLLLLDFGYVQKGLNTVDEINRIKELNPDKSTRSIIDEIVLNSSHIVNQSITSPKFYKRITKNFIEYKGNIYIYTYIPNVFEAHYTSANVRKNVTNNHFPNANIIVFDARKEFFNNTQFDNKYDKEYYPFLISKFISNIIEIEISKKIINSTQSIRKKFKQIKRNNTLKVVALLILSLFTGVFIPVLIDAINKGSTSKILTFTAAFVFLVAFLILIVFALEKKNSKLVE